MAESGEPGIAEGREQRSRGPFDCGVRISDCGMVGRTLLSANVQPHTAALRHRERTSSP